jgi:hypothetical protein
MPACVGVTQEDEKRLPLLFEHYGIEKGDYEALALALAREHVLGFR